MVTLIVEELGFPWKSIAMIKYVYAVPAATVSSESSGCTLPVMKVPFL